MTRLLLVLMLGVAACGGRAETTGPEGSGTPAPPARSDDDESPAKGSGSSLPSHDLGACKPGFARAQNPGRACLWIDAQGACFDTLNAACACICPADHDSVCWSSFPDGNGTPTRVHCN